MKKGTGLAKLFSAAKRREVTFELPGQFKSGSLLERRKQMPWYMNPVETRKVLNRIANRYQRTPLQDLKSVLDRATELIWSKQESYYQNRR